MWCVTLSHRGKIHDTLVIFVLQRRKNQAAIVNHDVLSRFDVIHYLNKNISKIYFSSVRERSVPDNLHLAGPGELST